MTANRLFKLSLLVACVLLTTGTIVQGTTIHFAHRWGEVHPTHSAFVATVELFQELHPDISVNILPDTSVDKFLLLAMGDEAPDIYVLGAQEINRYILFGLLEPITKLIDTDLDRESLVPTALEMGVWNNEYYGVGYHLDGVHLLFNPILMEQAGLPSNSSPATISELDLWAEKTTEYGPDGSLQQLGFYPQELFFYSNAVNYWAPKFGAEKYFDLETQQYLFNTAPFVEVLEWFLRYQQKYMLGANVWRRFIDGNMAMLVSTMGTVQRTRDNLGIVPYSGSTPTKPGVEDSFGPGCFYLVLPRGMSEDKKAAAWEFIKFLAADPVGTATFARISGCIPAYRYSDIWPEFYHDPFLRQVIPFYQQAVAPPNAGVPGWSMITSEINIAVERVFFENTSPQAALEDLNIAAQRILNEMLNEIPQ